MTFARKWRMGTSFYRFYGSFQNGVKAIIDAAKDDGIITCDDHGVGYPIINDYEIRFNGSRTLKQDYEGFAIGINSNPIWDNCKTNYMPYDSAVGAVLRLAQVYGYVYDVGRDGDWNEEEVDKLYRIGKGVADGIVDDLPY